VMPGGFARFGARPYPSAIAMQRGGSAADVWVVSPGPVARPSLVPAAAAAPARGTLGALPSRAADNLFWLGRYVERTEGMVRLLRAANIRQAEGGSAAAPLLAACAPLFAMQGIDPAQPIPQGLLDTLASAIGSAGRVRDRFSPDAWSALADLDKSARRMATRTRPGDDAARALSALLRKLAGISGLVHENMYRSMGWRFLTVGRLHERAMSMTAVLAVLADRAAPEGALDLAIEYGDSVMTHRRRFAVSTSRDTVIDLLGLDPLNPRSVRRQIDGLREEIDHLPLANDQGALSPLARAVLRLHADLATADPGSLSTRRLWSLRGRIGALSDQLTKTYFP
ncbi:MAG: alpha-E domain-containing protein, partial [Gemmobacter sp.]